MTNNPPLLPCQIKLREFIDHRATRELEKALGLWTPPGFMGTSTAAEKPKTLDENVLKEAIAKLRAIDQSSQEYLIALLAHMGFKVTVMQGFDEPTVFLPSRYQDAIQAVKARSTPAQKETEE